MKNSYNSTANKPNNTIKKVFYVLKEGMPIKTIALPYKVRASNEREMQMPLMNSVAKSYLA